MKMEHNLAAVKVLEVILRTLLAILVLLPSACNCSTRELLTIPLINANLCPFSDHKNVSPNFNCMGRVDR